MGTDYTYAYSQRFRDTVFRDNCLDQHLLVGVQDKPKVISSASANNPILQNNDIIDNSRIILGGNPEIEEENRRMESLRIDMEANSQFQIWISSATNYEGIRNIGHARQMLHQVERRQKDINFFGIVLSTFILCCLKTIF